MIWEKPDPDKVSPAIARRPRAGPPNTGICVVTDQGISREAFSIRDSSRILRLCGEGVPPGLEELEETPSLYGSALIR
jgi:hypothetical protein